jgi:SAM-dependent methyltransferase
MKASSKKHWETVYETKNSDQVSWTQEVPKTSLDFIYSFGLNKTAKLIDIGGGDSKLVDFLLDEGYEDITVLDISAKALDKTKQRLGNRADKVKWVVSDITEFEPAATFDLWHDRATFHFLTTQEQINKYMNTARKAVKGYLTIGTFSHNGPKKCSGLDIKQYNEETLTAELQNGFDKIRCITEDHITPFSAIQNFLFCSFKKTNLPLKFNMSYRTAN